jgi:RHS repeat-associated protein
MQIDYGYEGLFSFFEVGINTNVFTSLDERHTGVVRLVTIGAPVWEFIAENGTRTYFFAEGSPTSVVGMLWKIEDAAGNVAWIGHPTNAATASSSGAAGYSKGLPLFAIDPAGRRYVYSYSSSPIGEMKRLIQVEVHESQEVSSAVIARVSYDYYTSLEEDRGRDGDLRTVKVEQRLSDGASMNSTVQYYRYYNKTEASALQRSHLLKLIVGKEGCRQFDLDVAPAVAGSYLSASDDALKSYAQRYMNYESGTAARVSAYFTDGQCGCGGSAAGLRQLTYESNSSFLNNALEYDPKWKNRTIVERPDGAYETTYTDENGLLIASILSDEEPGQTGAQHWVTQVTRNAEGRTDQVRTSEAIASYSHSDGKIDARADQGLIRTFQYYETKPFDGILRSTKWKIGEDSALEYLESSSAFIDRTCPVQEIGTTLVSISRMMPSESWVYTEETTMLSQLGAPASGSFLTSTAYEFHQNTNWPSVPFNPAMLAVKSRTTTYPTISTERHGANAPAVETAYLTPDGRTVFRESRASSTASPIIDYTSYDSVTGQIDEYVMDVATSRITLPTWMPSSFSSSGAPLHLSTRFAYDTLGRVTDTTVHAHSSTKQRVAGVSYSQLADGRVVITKIAREVAGSSPTYFGPASFVVRDYAGNTTASGTLKIPASGTTTNPTNWVDSTKSDPLLAMAFDISGYRTSAFSQSGARRTASRNFFSLSSSTGYDETTYAYDSMGRLTSTTIPAGTINETVFDAIGRPSAKRVGTNNTTANNMVTTELYEYDNGGIGNSHRTKMTRRVDSTSNGERVFETVYDQRGRAIISKSPLSPHSVSKYDNLDRAVASATYNSYSGLSLTTDPAAISTSRLSYSETKYDERGRVYESRMYKVEQPGGPSDAEPSGGRKYISRGFWYDHEGRNVKTVGDLITKTAYDRVGRAVTQYTIATSDDRDVSVTSASDNPPYLDVLNVSGDIVLEQSSTVFDPDTENVVMSVAVSRFHVDVGSSATTGSLDTNSDNSLTAVTFADLKGRAQIMAMYYDELDREVDTVNFGTNGGSTFTLPSSAPARSDTALRATTAYDLFGRVDTIEGPDGVKSKSLYDDAGRPTANIDNYTGQSLTNLSRTNDIYTRKEYTHGLLTRLWVDLDGDGNVDTTGAAGSQDQETVYTYGVSPSDSDGPSKIAAGHVLRRVFYPDSTGTSDSVTYSYDAQFERIRVKDQAGNVIEHDYDAVGRIAHRRATNIDSSFDDLVKRISMTYDDRGMPATVTQYDNAAAGSGNVVDQVGRTYDAWGNLGQFRQDWNSPLASSSGDDHEVSYGYEDAHFPGSSVAVRTVRRNELNLPYAGTIALEYNSADGSLDDAANRVSSVFNGPIELASYQYLGASDVVGISLNQPQLLYRRYEPGDNAKLYSRLDRFDRVQNDVWDRRVTTPGNAAYDLNIYHVNLSHDRNGSVTLADDKVYELVDYSYTLDARMRLTGAKSGTAVEGAIPDPDPETSPPPIWSSSTWSLSQTGNWDVRTFDKDARTTDADSEDINQSNSFNRANELTSRTVNGTTTSPIHDAVGNLTNDGKSYQYRYDVWGRLREVKTLAGALVAEYRYNGLGYRTGWHYDADASGSVSTSDPWYYSVFDESWRAVATYRVVISSSGGGASWSIDTNPKEVFVNHFAGLGGRGGALPLDFVIHRNREALSPGQNANEWIDNWTAQAGSLLDERTYFCQNWRGDVVALFDDVGGLVNQIRYDPYGMPFGIPKTDFDGDGAHGLADLLIWYNAYDGEFGDPQFPPRRWADVNLDGVVDFSDFLAFYSAVDGDIELGRGKLGYPSGRPHGNIRRGYAGAELAIELTSGAPGTYHLRNRVYQAEEGRWTRRDPIGYHDGMNLYEYVQSSPVDNIDPMGLKSLWCNGGAGGCGGGGGEPPSGGGSRLNTDPRFRPDYKFQSPARLLTVCCNPVAASTNLVHCELRWNGCMAGQWGYPVWTDYNSNRALPDGTPCDKATHLQIQDCVGTNPQGYPSNQYSWNHNNCQTNTRDRLTKCCLKTTWAPNIHACARVAWFVKWKWRIIPAGTKGPIPTITYGPDPNYIYTAPSAPRMLDPRLPADPWPSLRNGEPRPEI